MQVVFNVKFENDQILELKDILDMCVYFGMLNSESTN